MIWRIYYQLLFIIYTVGAYRFTYKHHFTDSIYFSAELLQALFSKVNQFGG